MEHSENYFLRQDAEASLRIGSLPSSCGLRTEEAEKPRRVQAAAHARALWESRSAGQSTAMGADGRPELQTSPRREWGESQRRMRASEESKISR